MGYMGFGMQSYVYKRQPRKPFTKHGRIPSFPTLSENYKSFKLKKRVKEKNFKIGLGTVISVLLVALLMINFGFKIKEHTNLRTESIKENLTKKDITAFKFLIASGKNRLNRGDIEDAYSEFILAHKIYPKNETLNQLLTETLSILCADSNTYCIELNELLSRKT